MGYLWRFLGQENSRLLKMSERTIRSLLISLLITLSLISTAANSYYLLLFISAFSLCTFLYLLYRVFQISQLTRFLLVSSLTCGAWLSMGFLQSYYNILRIEFQVEKFPDLFAYTSTVINPSLYSLAFSYAISFILGMTLIAEQAWLRREEYEFTIMLRTYVIKAPAAIYRTILFLISVALSYVSISNLYAVRGFNKNYISNSNADILPWWFVAINFILGMLPLLLALLLQKGIRRMSITSNFLLAYSLAIGIYYYLLRGRFLFLSFFLLIGSSSLIIYGKKIKLTWSLVAKLTLILIALNFFIPLISNTFSYINTLRYQTGLSLSPVEIIMNYLQFITSPVETAAAAQKATSNLASRPLVLWPLASSIQMFIDGTNNGLIGFEDIFNSFLNSLPRFVIRFKGELFLQEQLLYRSFPFSFSDTADSPYLYAFASFGLWGIVIYPIAISVFYYFSLKVSKKVAQSTLPTIIKTYFLLFALSQLLTFAILSYGELATTGLIRKFVVIILIALPLLTCSIALPTKPKYLSKQHPE